MLASGSSVGDLIAPQLARFFLCTNTVLLRVPCKMPQGDSYPDLGFSGLRFCRILGGPGLHSQGFWMALLVDF